MVDLVGMSRLLSLPLLLLTALVIGFLAVTQARDHGPTSQTATHAETLAVQAATGVNFRAADAAMQAFFSSSSTYAGATLDPSYQVALVRADATSYCLQASVAGQEEHEVGPGGAPAQGAC
jgi:hypothetical protein